MAGSRPTEMRSPRRAMKNWPPSLPATSLPVLRNDLGLQGLRPIAARPSTGWPRRMDLSAAKSPFPIRNGCRSMREKRKARAIAPSRTSGHPWRVRVATTEVPDTGLHLDLAADEKVRADIARLAGIAALPRLDST